MERLIRQRKESPELGWGRVELLESTGPILAHRCDWNHRTVIAVHNLSDSSASLTLPKDDNWASSWTCSAPRTATPAMRSSSSPMVYRWLRPEPSR